MAKALFFFTVFLFFQGCVLSQLEQQQQQSWQGSTQQQQPYGPYQQQQGSRRYQQTAFDECRIQNIQAVEPSRTIKSEAGITEHWDQNQQQFRCAGVAITRHVIEARGLLLPQFSNAPKLTYVVQGRGMKGAVLPGCPETYQSIQQVVGGRLGAQSRSRSSDQHQKIREVNQGDVLALPTGIPHWFYNDGETPLVLVTLLDTGNNANQLDQNARRFFLAGNPQTQGQGKRSFQSRHQTEQERQETGDNVFSGFDVEILAEAFGVSRETARSLQSRNDQRGNIVLVKQGLGVVRPPLSEEEEEREQGQQTRANGLEETLCAARLVHNIGDPTSSDVYNPNAGRITSLNSQKLPILSYLQLSAERGVLYRNAIMAPHWNLNAHSIIYITRGSGRIQIVGNQRQPVFDGQVARGQVLTVPQNFAVVKQAGNEGLEWIAFKTNDNAMMSPIVGRTSALRAIPEEVLMNSYRISREEARRLKFNRDQEMYVFQPRSGSQQQQETASP